MSNDLIITATLVGTTKNNHKLQLDKTHGGCVGAVYIPKTLQLPKRIIIEVNQ